MTNLEQHGIIYKITNTINNKVYIGQTIKDFDKRYSYNLEKYTRNEHLKNAIHKYGIDNFEIDKNFDIAFSQDELDKKEKYWINYYNSTDRKYGYNLMTGGSYGKHTEETKEKMSKSHKGLLSKENHPFYGKHHTEETRQKISINLQNKVVSEEAKKKISKSRKGKTHYGKEVYQYDKELNLIKIWNSEIELKENGFQNSCISKCCLGHRKTHKGYIWSFYNLQEVA